MTHPLDNPIFGSLDSRHARFAHGAGAALRFESAVSPLAGLEADAPAGWEALAGLLADGQGAGVFAWELPADTAPLAIVRTHPLVQMLHTGPLPAPRPLPAGTRDLGLEDADAMIELVKLTQPGPMERRTVTLGHYLGVFEGGALIAMSGERLKLPGFTEVSAVCTHPDHRGRGLAGALMTHLMHEIAARNETPFLHVAADNPGAQKLYETLGFTVRNRGWLVIVQAPA